MDTELFSISMPGTMRRSALRSIPSGRERGGAGWLVALVACLMLLPACLLSLDELPADSTSRGNGDAGAQEGDTSGDASGDDDVGANLDANDEDPSTADGDTSDGESPGICGDGLVDGDEECDDGEFNSDTVPDACRTDCTASSCGDGVADSGERCDSDDLLGQTCVDAGFEGGTLRCAASCDEFVTTRCTADCPPGAPDADGDGVCDRADRCPGESDALDGDGDGVPNGCDECPGSDDYVDSDRDTVADGCDVCPGGDDRVDRDEDGVADGCDECPDDPRDDRDGDGACDSADRCPDNPDLSAAANACGGCSTLDAEPSEPCGVDGRYECSGSNAVRCVDVFGAPCEEADDCTRGQCSASGFCAPPGFSYIPAGTFTMGSPPDELRRDDDERQHEVTLTGGFFLQQTEVTQGQWQALMGNNPSEFGACGDDCPVENVNWWDAVGYLNALSRSEGLSECYTLSGCDAAFGENPECTGVTVNAAGGNPYDCEGYRLPTESEWEYACRAGTTTAFYNGEIDDERVDSDLDVIGWYSNNSGSMTHPVGEKAPNDWGLYDMLGNVWEWTWDWYGDYPSGSVMDPLGPSTGGNRVRRGGSWVFSAFNARSANRRNYRPTVRGNDLGFRPARSN